MTRRWAATLLLVLALALVASACSGDPVPQTAPPGQPPASDPTPTGTTTLTFGVFGEREKVAAYREMVAGYNQQAQNVRVRLKTWRDRKQMLADFADGEGRPDLFLASRRDLAEVVTEGYNRPLFELLETRNISYGDGFSERAIGAFSADDDLQCMPYSVAPMMIYYNTDLIDFDRMRRRGLPAPRPDELSTWTLEAFAAAARFATRKGQRSRGVSVEPSLSSLAPFLYSGGGQLFDDEDEPTSLTLSSEENVETLTEVLELLRDPTVTLTDKQLAKADPVQWFKRGRLGMIEGFRSLTPELREVPGLSFDVMPMPQVDEQATVGDITGLCISPGPHVQRAADFLVYAISQEGFTQVSRSGYVVPAGLAVARSDAFLQPQQQPEHAAYFNASVYSMELLPYFEGYDEVSRLVAPNVRRLLTDPVLADLPAILERIDAKSRRLLAPAYGSGSPSPDEDSDEESDGS